MFEKDGILRRGDRIVVPTRLRPKALRTAHDGHPGMLSTRKILRERVWWPRMDRDNEDHVRNCVSCTLVARADPPPPMTRTRLPSGPWEQIGIDFCGPFVKHGGVLILVVADYYSRFVSTAILRSTDYNSTARALDNLFGIFGYPLSLKADNGPPFQSAEFGTFCRSRGIELIRTIPYHPEQNGLAERNMQVVGKAMKIAWSAGKDYKKKLAAAIKAHNQAPHSVTGAVPEELMFGRKIRRELPSLRKQENRDDDGIRDADWTAKTKGKLAGDLARHAKHPNLEAGDEVVLLNKETGKLDTRFASAPLTIRSRNNGEVWLEDENGKALRRHTTHVKKRPRTEKEGEAQALEEEEKGADSEMNPVRKSTRVTKKPEYLKAYTNAVAEQGGT